MGQQQLLLIILGVIIVGVAIAVGISMFSGQSVAANRDAIMADLTTLGSDAYQYKIRPSMMGGGNGTYSGYTIQSSSVWGPSNPNAWYDVVSQSSTRFVVEGLSKQVTGAWASVTFDGNGNIVSGPTPVGF